MNLTFQGLVVSPDGIRFIHSKSTLLAQRPLRQPCLVTVESTAGLRVAGREVDARLWYSSASYAKGRFDI